MTLEDLAKERLSTATSAVRIAVSAKIWFEAAGESRKVTS
jgi:hypothetical protein